MIAVGAPVYSRIDVLPATRSSPCHIRRAGSAEDADLGATATALAHYQESGVVRLNGSRLDNAIGRGFRRRRFLGHSDGTENGENEERIDDF